MTGVTNANRRGFLRQVAAGGLAAAVLGDTGAGDAGAAGASTAAAGRLMRCPANYYQQFDADYEREVPAEGYGGWQRAEVELDLDHTALVSMHAWETGTREQYPGWYRAVEYIPPRSGDLPDRLSSADDGRARRGGHVVSRRRRWELLPIAAGLPAGRCPGGAATRGARDGSSRCEFEEAAGTPQPAGLRRPAQRRRRTARLCPTRLPAPGETGWATRAWRRTDTSSWLSASTTASTTWCTSGSPSTGACSCRPEGCSK